MPESAANHPIRIAQLGDLHVGRRCLSVQGPGGVNMREADLERALEHLAEFFGCRLALGQDTLDVAGVRLHLLPYAALASIAQGALRPSTATASWALDRSPPARRVFEQRFGSLEVSLAAFTAGPAPAFASRSSGACSRPWRSAWPPRPQRAISSRHV